MYTTLRFKNGISVDVMHKEIMGWSWGLDGQLEPIAELYNTYDSDDELVKLLQYASGMINPNEHRDVFDFLFSNFNREGDSFKYDECGRLIVNLGGKYTYEELYGTLKKLSEISTIGDVGDDWGMDGGLYRPVYDDGKEIARIY